MKSPPFRERLAERWHAAGSGLIVESAGLGAALWFLFSAPGLLPSYLDGVGGLIGAAMVGVLAALGGAARGLRLLVATVAGCLAIVAATPLVNLIAERWIRGDPLPAAGVDAVVPLSANLNDAGAISAEALAHLVSALEIVESGQARVLLTTTTEATWGSRYVTSGADQAHLVRLFGGEVEWLHTPLVHTTHDEAVAAAAILLPRHLDHIAVVASPMHTRRACATFEAVGFRVTCIVSRTTRAGGRNPADEASDRIRSFGDWVYEVAAMVEYRLRGWLPARASRR